MSIYLRTEPTSSQPPSALQHLPLSEPDAGLDETIVDFPVDSGRRLIVRVNPDTKAGGTRPSAVNGPLMNVLASLAKRENRPLEREVEAIFDRICEWPEIERAGLWCRFNRGDETITLAHQYPSRQKRITENRNATAGEKSNLAAPTITWTAPSELCAGPTARFPWIDGQLQAGETVIFSSLAELPSEAEQDKQALGRIGLNSAVIIPFQVEGVVTGAISFARSAKQHTWRREKIESLKLVTHVLAHGIAHKLQEEKLTEALNEVRQLKSALNAHAIVTISDVQGTIRYANDNFCEFLRYSRDELLGKTYSVIKSGNHPDDFFAQLWTTIARGEVWRGEIQNRAKDGELCWTAMTIVPVVDEQAKPREYISIGFNITERKLAEEALGRSYLEIKQLKEKLQAETDYLRTEIKISQAHGEIIGESQAIKRVLQQVEQVAPVECSVLITGETGTGKELVARAIHRLSARRDRVMVMVNCAALPSALVESELFGRERGAYTGALTSEVGRFEFANGSTIFLDEIGELSMEVQAKLLRVLQEGEFQRLGNPKTRKVNLRVLAASNKDLAKEVREGRFREDLYYRLQVFPIKVPPLRERMEDLPMLVSAFVEEFSSRMSKQINRLPRKVIEALERHAWPGNIRELRNVIERGVILSSGETLSVPALTASAEAVMPRTSLAEVERDHILKTLRDANWRVKGPYGAAKRLQVNPSTLYSRMAKLEIHRDRPGDGLPM
jgi:formate hydrogenlyase transcriptional activator